MRSPEEVAREWEAVVGENGSVDEPGYLRDLARFIRARDAEVEAEVERLRAGIESEHGPVQEFEPCPTEWKGCDDPACTESAHDGGLYHDDQPTGHVCLTCRDEDGAPRDWPCPTAALLNPTEGEAR